MPANETWSDDAIKGPGQDRFLRARFAQLIADTIDTVPAGGASTVFGLVGTWGSGKSSVASLITGFLPQSWIVRSFAPWSANGITGLQAEFASVLDDALGGPMAHDQAARAALKKYVQIVRPFVEMIPTVGRPIADLAVGATDRHFERRPWATEYEEMTSSLKTLGKRVLIVCDDIDRLDATELLEFLKVVRLLGRFPNVHYLVAYDADTVEDLLAAQGVDGRTSSFMEKIVQHPFELPTLDFSLRWRHAADAIERYLTGLGSKLDDGGFIRFRLLVDALATGLTTPRRFSRFEKHMNVLVRMVPGEVDVLDFAAVSYLQLNHHEIYDRLPDWTQTLREGLRYEVAGKTHNEAGLSEKDWQARLSEVSRRGDSDNAWPIICFLYPNLEKRDSSPLHARAFANGLYEERYFSLGVPSNDVSDVLVERAISSWLQVTADAAAEAELKTLLREVHPSVARVAVGKMRAHRRQVEATTLVPLIDVLSQESARVEALKYDVSSPGDVIFEWLADEVLNAYSSAELSLGDVIDRFGEEGAIDVLLRITAPFGSSRDGRVAAMLSDFGTYFYDALGRPGDVGLRPWEYLRSKLALVARSSGSDLVGILDAKVDDDISTFEAVAIAMVKVVHWRGMNDVRLEIAFETDTWTTAVSEPVRRRMAALLTAEFDEEPVDEEDASEGNRRRLAIKSVRRDALTGEPGSTS